MKNQKYYRLIPALCFVPSILNRIAEICSFGISFNDDVDVIISALYPIILALLIIIGILIESRVLIGVTSIIKTIIAIILMSTYIMSIASYVPVYPGELNVYLFLTVIRLAIGILGNLLLAVACLMRNRNKGKILCIMSAVTVFVQTAFSIVFFKPVTVATIIVNVCLIVGTVLIGKYVIDKQMSGT